MRSSTASEGVGDDYGQTLAELKALIVHLTQQSLIQSTAAIKAQSLSEERILQRLDQTCRVLLRQGVREDQTYAQGLARSQFSSSPNCELSIPKPNPTRPSAPKRDICKPVMIGLPAVEALNLPHYPAKSPAAAVEQKVWYSPRPVYDSQLPRYDNNDQNGGMRMTTMASCSLAACGSLRSLPPAAKDTQNDGNSVTAADGNGVSSTGPHKVSIQIPQGHSFGSERTSLKSINSQASSAHQRDDLCTAASTLRSINEQSSEEWNAAFDNPRGRKALTHKSSTFNRSSSGSAQRAPSAIDDKSNDSPCWNSANVKKNWWVINPESRFRCSFDAFAFFFLLYDAITIPFMLAWDPDIVALKTGMLVTTVFWTCDMCLSMITGFHRKGEVVMDSVQIVRRYVRSWFPIDTFLVVTDWISVILDHTGAAEVQVSFVRVIKVHRLLRIFGWVRASKLWTRFATVGQVMVSETWQTVRQVGSLFFFILWFNHMFSCCWYFIGAHRSLGDTGETWLDLVEGPEAYGEKNMLYQYTTSYHWALTQMTPGSMQVFPRNSAERLLNIVCLLLGLLFCTSLVSQLSAKMVQLQMAKQEQRRSLLNVRRYLLQHQITPALANRVGRYIMKQFNEKKPLVEADVRALDLLSPNLKAVLRQDMFEPYLVQNTFIRLMNKVDDAMLRDFCHGTELKTAMEGSELFTANMATDKTYIVMRGTVKYVLEVGSVGDETWAISWTQSQTSNLQRVPSNSAGDEFPELRKTATSKFMTSENVDTVLIKKGTWISEGALWTAWTTKGTAEASELCELMCINAQQVFKALRRHRIIKALIQGYGKSWQEVMCNQETGEAVTDLPCAEEGQCEAIMCMPLHSRTLLARPILDELRYSNWSRWLTGMKSIDELEAEVSAGKCSLLVGHEGHPERIALVVVVKLERPDGRILVECARVTKGACSTVCQLPGIKLNEGENPQEAARRILLSELSYFAKDWEWSHCSRTTEVKTSKAYGMETRYIRRTFDVQSKDCIDVRDSVANDDGELGCEPPIPILVTKTGLSPGAADEQSFMRNNLARASTSRSSRRRSSAAGRASWSMVKSMVKTDSNVHHYELPPGLPHEVYLVRTQGSREGHVYAWLAPEDFEVLKASNLKWIDLGTVATAAHLG